MTPLSGPGVFAHNKRHLYVWGRVDDQLDPHKVQLLKVDLEQKTFIPMLAAPVSEHTHLVLHGYPTITAVTAVSFANEEARLCSAGAAKILTLSLDLKTKGPRAVKSEGRYAIIFSNRGQVLADLSQQSVLTLDTETLQTRSLGKFSNAEKILLQHASEPVSVTWAMGQGQSSELVRRVKGSPKGQPRLTITRPDRLIQLYNLFAIARPDYTNQTLTIQELPGWTGIDREKSYSFKVPKEFDLGKTSLSISFAKGLVLLSQLEEPSKQLAIVKYTEDKILNQWRSQNVDRIYFAGLSPFGDYAVAATATPKGSSWRSTIQIWDGKVWTEAKLADIKLESSNIKK